MAKNHSHRLREQKAQPQHRDNCSGCGQKLTVFHACPECKGNFCPKCWLKHYHYGWGEGIA